MAYLHLVKTPEGPKSFFTPDKLYALDDSLAGGGHWEYRADRITHHNFPNRFHQVRSYDRNIAVNVWWTHKVNFIPKDCNMEPNQTLDKFNFSSLQAESSDQEQAGPPDLM